MDERAIILPTVPIIFPAIVNRGFDPIWFGLVSVMAVSPASSPRRLGMNVFLINSIARDTPLPAIFRGVMPFIVTDLPGLVIIGALPWLSLASPATMT